MKKLFIYLSGITILMSCVTTRNVEPLLTVIRLQAAETVCDFDDAKKYIDVARTYKSFVGDSLDAEAEWRKFHTFQMRLARDPKFTNVVQYGNYDISSKVSGKTAIVDFKDIRDQRHSNLTYTLESENKKWRVVAIKIDTVR